jgi:hypothetical protein
MVSHLLQIYVSIQVSARVERAEVELLTQECVTSSSRCAIANPQHRDHAFDAGPNS